MDGNAPERAVDRSDCALENSKAVDGSDCPFEKAMDENDFPPLEKAVVGNNFSPESSRAVDGNTPEMPMDAWEQLSIREGCGWQ